jgi:heme/copper-type cytochrome/quinol oxidase subunit 2
MRGLVLLGFGIIAGGVFICLYVGIWRARKDPRQLPGFGQSITSELIWATIPILMIIAAILPAALAMV